jgi:pyridinium-3,5-biscarboxylic acid mononucleotide sulfurtransferase
MIEKIQKLECIIRAYQRVIIGYSGGVDSTLVAHTANRVLGKNALIVLASTETITREDVELARRIAEQFQFNYREINYKELEIAQYAANPVNRCYFCKQELYVRLHELAENEHISVILDGANLDDIGDYRPGRQAAKESKVFSPLIEAGMTKQDVRDAAASAGLPNYDKPAAPCLSSRIPYGTPIDMQALDQIARAEKYIRDRGFKNVRVRHYQTTAKIEVDAEAVVNLKEIDADVQSYLKHLGYTEVIIDEEGFKSGKLNRGVVHQ